MIISIKPVYYYRVASWYDKKLFVDFASSQGRADDDLDWESRWSRMVDEIFSFECDVVCLQEVDNAHFQSHFIPAFRERGFSGVYKKRTNDKNDGCAIFYKESRVKRNLSTIISWKAPLLNQG